MSEAIDNIDYLKKLAEEGRSAPLMGGGIGLMWSGLLIGTLLAHGILAKLGAPFGGMEFLALWAGFGVIGGIASAIMGKKLESQANATPSLGNKLESKLWQFTSLLIFSFTMAIVVANAIGTLDTHAYGFIMPMAFAMYALNYATIARFVDAPMFNFGAISAAISMGVRLILASRPEAYFAATLGVFFAAGVPSVASIRRAGQ